MSTRDLPQDGQFVAKAAIDLEHESSGVTSLVPVPVKPALYEDLDESERTQFFSTDELVARGKSLAERAAPEPAGGVPTPPEPAPLPAPAPRAGPLHAFREASLARKASVIMLPLLLGLLAVKPVFKPPQAHAAATSAQTAAAAPIALAPSSTKQSPPIAAAAASFTLPRGVSLEHAAADSVGAGDFMRALVLYRELCRREPKSAALCEAARILQERERTAAP